MTRAGIEINPGPDDFFIYQFKMTTASGDLEAVRSLLGLDPSLATSKLEGLSALHYAAREGHTTVIKELLQLEADIEGKAPNGQTPLILAMLKGNTATVEYLLSKGALQVSSDDGHSPLMVAIQNGQEAVSRLLIAHTSYLDKRHPKTGFTAIHSAAIRGYHYHTILEDLLTSGTSVDFQLYITGKTALSAACQYGLCDIAVRGSCPYVFICQVKMDSALSIRVSQKYTFFIILANIQNENMAH